MYGQEVEDQPQLALIFLTANIRAGKIMKKLSSGFDDMLQCTSIGRSSGFVNFFGIAPMFFQLKKK
jgi:hypothetical protein